MMVTGNDTGQRLATDTGQQPTCSRGHRACGDPSHRLSDTPSHKPSSKPVWMPVSPLCGPTIARMLMAVLCMLPGLPILAQGGPRVSHQPDSIAHEAWDGEQHPSAYLATDQLACDQLACNPVGFLLDWSRCELSIGTTAFSAPSNFLTTGLSSAGQIEGNFGFQESVNFGSCLPGLMGNELGAQLGLRAIQSQLEGTTAGTDQRSQLFVTGGLFRRVDYGVQGGLVVDFLHDDSLFSADLLQLRGELGYMLSACHDAGFRFTSSQRTSRSTARIDGIAAPVAVNLTALDTYRFFYRFRMGDQARAAAEMNAGFTEDKAAVLGVNLSTPLQGSVGLAASTTYLIPPSTAEPGYAHQSWNLSLALVWTPGRGFGCDRDYYRPLFDVADNGSLLTKRP